MFQGAVQRLRNEKLIELSQNIIISENSKAREQYAQELAIFVQNGFSTIDLDKLYNRMTTDLLDKCAKETLKNNDVEFNKKFKMLESVIIEYDQYKKKDQRDQSFLGGVIKHSQTK
jgi:hypothetical protein